MNSTTALLATKIKLSARTIAWVMPKRYYAFLALIIAFLFFELIYWLPNLNVLFTILTSSKVTLAEKLAVLASPIESISSSSGMGFLIIIILLAIVQGISLSVLTYVMRHQPKVDSKLIGGSAFVTLLAAIGLGCPACGTSLVTPIVALFISGSSVAISEQITAIVTPLALIIGLYGLYIIGLRAANIRALSSNTDELELVTVNNT